MVTPRIAFDRPTESCTACGADLPADPPPPPTRFTLPTPAVELSLCGACRARIAEDGLPPPPFVPAFRFDGAFRLPAVTLGDLDALLRAVARSAARPVDAETMSLIDRATTPRLADHEAWAARVHEAAGQPDPLDVAGLLVTGAALDLEPAPPDELRETLLRARASDELMACFGAYSARVAHIERWRQHADPPTGRALRLLEHADRALLFATLPSSHPLAERATQIRIGVTLALRRGSTLDSLLLQIGREDPRSQLLRGLRFLQQDHHAAADREFRAATENPFAGFDPEIDAAAIWNRTVRALATSRLDEAKDALRAYCRLRPDDVEARIALGHVYVQSARDEVAREVLESALDHLRTLADTPSAEGPLLYASCLLRLDDARAARRSLERLLDDRGDTSDRRAEVERLAARCALATGAAEDALDHLATAWSIDPTARNAHEVAWAAAAALRTRLELHGVPGLLALVERHPWLGPALRKRYGALHTLLCASFVQHQVRGGFRPQQSFGLEWSWIGAQGANARSSTFQAYACLARHQIPAALQHDLAAQGSGAAAVPFATLSALLDAARRATPDQLELLNRLLTEIAQHALRDLDAGR